MLDKSKPTIDYKPIIDYAKNSIFTYLMMMSSLYAEAGGVELLHNYNYTL